MKKALKVAFLYIGTMVGAGFSSGREIALFFRGLSPVSSIVMSLFALLFLTAGKLKLIPSGKIIHALILFSASISLISMLAGGEYIMRTMTTLPLLALVMAILSATVVSAGIEKIKIINAILVPLIVISIILLFTKVPSASGDLNFSFTKPIMYGGLDILLGGMIISKDGEDLKMKEIVLSCILVCAFLFAMLYMLQTVVLFDKNGSLMPVFAVSAQYGMQPVCGILIAAAIFTTLISSLKIVSDSILYFLKTAHILPALHSDDNKSIVVFFALTVLYPFSFFGFGKIVDTLYPINSILGIVLATVVCVRLLMFLIANIRRNITKARKIRQRKTAPQCAEPSKLLPTKFKTP